MTGLSSEARGLRKRRNLVTVQFNFMNWLLETTSLIVLTVGDRDGIFFNLIYFTVTSCGTPLVILLNLLLLNIFLPILLFLIYFLGIEENRKRAREHVSSSIKIFTRKKDKVAPAQD